MSSATSAATPSMPWILGTPGRDLAWILAPGFAVFAVAPFLRGGTWPALAVATLCVWLCDSGHVYTTLLRTYVRLGESVRLSSGWRLTYAAVPAVVLLVAFAWVFFGVPGFWIAVFYATLFHHIRQLYGVVRWYEKLNGRVDRLSHYLIYAMPLLALFVGHARPLAIESLRYDSHDRLFVASWLLLPAGVLLALHLLLWLGHELRLRRQGVVETNRALAVGLPGVLFAACAFFGTNEAELLYPLLVTHALTYFALTRQSMIRTQSVWRAQPTGALVAVLSVAAVCGWLDFAYEHWVLPPDPAAQAGHVMTSLLVAVAVTPAIWHYAMDMVLWRRGHPEAAQVFASVAPAS